MTERYELRKLYREIRGDPAFEPLRRSGARFVPGEGREWFPRVVVVGEAPGATEDTSGRPFVGASGALLNSKLFQVGLGREEVFITNVVKYRLPKNRTPELDEILAAGLHLRSEIRLLSPESGVVVTLGAVALSMFRIGVGISELHGRPLPGAGWFSGVVLPLYHPAAVLRGSQTRDEYLQDFKALEWLL